MEILSDYRKLKELFYSSNVCDDNNSTLFREFTHFETKLIENENQYHSKINELEQKIYETQTLLDGTSLVLENKNFIDIARQIFNYSKELIGAQAGYVALLNENGYENDVLFLDEGNLPCTVDPSLPMPIRGLRGVVYRTGKTSFDNDYDNSDHAKFMPHGHIPLYCVMFAPLKINNQPIGLLGLSGKKGGFTDHDAMLATTFAEYISSALVNARNLEKLVESDERFRAIFEQDQSVKYLLDVGTGQIIDANSAALNFYGYSRQELLAMNIAEINMKSFEKIKDLLNSAIDLKLNRYELKHKLASGEIRDVEIYSTPIVFNSKKFLLSSVHDITDRKLAERAITESEDLLRSLTDSINAYIAIIDANTLNYKFVNKNFVTRFRKTKEQIVGMNIRDLIGADDFDLSAKYFDAVRRGETVSYVREFHSDDSKQVFLNVSYFPRFDANNLVHEFIFLGFNITDMVMSEQTIRESEKKYHSIFNNSVSAIILADIYGRYIDVNPAFSKITGYLRDEVVGNEIGKITHPEDLLKIKNILSNALVDDINSLNDQIRIIHKDGSVIWIHFSANVYYNDKGLFEYILIDFFDITSIKTAEIQLYKYTNELNQINKDKDRFVSILAHDLKSPFNSLIGFSELLLKSIYSYDIEKIKKQVGIINQTANKTYSLLCDLLLWSKSQTGKLIINPQNIVFEDACLSIFAVFREKANSKNISLSCFSGCGSYLVVDSNIFNTVLRNLISNAIKFTPSNGTVSIFMERDDVNYTITVADTGVGIAEDDLMLIWDLNNQNSTSGTGGEKGSGFGLLLCKELIEKIGGRIWAESQIDNGSRFFFTIPIAI